MSLLRLYTPLAMVTLLLSAFLLFSVEPMAGKMILPLLGGTPQVWNTAMVFFQAMLLAGYGYAHLSARWLTVRAQAALHLALGLLCLYVLPVAVPAAWPAADLEHPIRWQLHLMTVMAGAPFFLLAASAPLIQHWFSRSGHGRADNPYFLYAASNAGSLSALLAYPVLIEPGLSLGEQSRWWMAGFVIVIALMAATGCMTGRGKPAAATGIKPERIGNGTRAKWLALAFIPSSLMLGVTTFITTDIAAVPLLWVAPLALYVLTFIIAFGARPLLSARIAGNMQAALLLILLGLSMLHMPLSAFIVIGLHLGLFFFAALLCHCELAHIRPGPARLTEFYLILSLGGVLGGMFNALAAPMLFVMPVEYALALGLACFARSMHAQVLTLRYTADNLTRWFAPLCAVMVAAYEGMRYAGYENHAPEICAAVALVSMVLMIRNRIAFAAGAMILLGFNPGFSWTMMHNTLLVERNFFGVARVRDSAYGQMRLLMEGTTMHGAQPLVSPYRLVPMGYYHPQSPAGDVFGFLDRRDHPQSVAALGLGVGSIACYTKPGRHFDFYEIDPVVPKIAQNTDYFTYLAECGSPYKIVPGDARLSIRAAPDRGYDLIFLDAFSSDNIPIHLLTVEAFKLYLTKLKPDGLIAADISNRYMDLIPVMQAAADATGMKVFFKDSRTIDVVKPDVYAYATLYAVFVPPGGDASLFLGNGWGVYDGARTRAWTDDYANPLAAMWFMQKRDATKSKPPAQK